MPRGLVSGVIIGFVKAPAELSAAGLIVPPSVTPSPAVWAEYIAADADGAMQRREARQRQVFRLPQCWKVAPASARLRPEAQD